MNRIVLTAALLSFSLSCAAQLTHPSGVSNCIARWDFHNQTSSTVLQDVSGNNHNGTITNMASVAGYRGRVIEAMHFNGSNSFAQVPTDTQLNPQQISIVALVNFSDFNSGNCQTSNIIYKSVSYFTTGCWAMMVDDQRFDNNCNQYSPANQQLDFAASSTVNYTVPANNYLLKNQWYLLVNTYDGDTLKRYQIAMDTITWLNSITPISKSKLNTPLGTNNDDVIIGATQNATYPYRFNGDMDEIALFNKVLSDTDVQLIYDYFRGPRPTSVNAATLNPEDFIYSYDGHLIVKNPSAHKDFNVAVFDMSGRLLKQVQSNEALINIDMKESFPSQVLVIKVTSENASFSKKVITIE